jgi:hypothetical protein
MAYSSREQFCFPPIERVAVRGGFDGGATVVGLRPHAAGRHQSAGGLSGRLA